MFIIILRDKVLELLHISCSISYWAVKQTSWFWCSRLAGFRLLVFLLLFFSGVAYKGHMTLFIASINIAMRLNHFLKLIGGINTCFETLFANLFAERM